MALCGRQGRERGEISVVWIDVGKTASFVRSGKRWLSTFLFRLVSDDFGLEVSIYVY